MSFLPKFRPAYVLQLAAGVLLAGLFGACTPMSDTERAYIEQRKQELDDQKALGDKMKDGAEQLRLINKVKEYEMADGRTTEQWLRTMMINVDGKMLSGLDRWRAAQKSESRYEVSFTYSYMDEENTVHKKGYAWMVDDVVDQVSPPRPLKLGETGESVHQRSIFQQRQARREHAELTLE